MPDIDTALDPFIKTESFPKEKRKITSDPQLPFLGICLIEKTWIYINMCKRPHH